MNNPICIIKSGTGEGKILAEIPYDVDDNGKVVGLAHYKFGELYWNVEEREVAQNLPPSIAEIQEMIRNSIDPRTALQFKKEITKVPVVLLSIQPTVVTQTKRGKTVDEHRVQIKWIKDGVVSDTWIGLSKNDATIEDVFDGIDEFIVPITDEK